MINAESNAAFQVDRQKTIKPSEQILPLVIEIIPGQAAEGLIEVFEPGTYEGKSLQDLVDEILSREDWSLEDRQILVDIAGQRHGGKLLWRGQEILGDVKDYAVLERTDVGEEYLYAPVRVIKPQEGGSCPSAPLLRSLAHYVGNVGF